MVYSFVLWVPTPFFSWANIIESVIGSKVNGPIKSQPKAQKKRSHFLVNHEANWTQWPNCLEKESWQQHWENHVFWVHLSSLLHIYSFNLQLYIKNCTTWSIAQRYLLLCMKTKWIWKYFKVDWSYLQIRLCQSKVVYGVLDHFSTFSSQYIQQDEIDEAKNLVSLLGEKRKRCMHSATQL